MNQYKGEEAYYKNKAAKEIVACDIASELVENPMDVDLNNLGEGLMKPILIMGPLCKVNNFTFNQQGQFQQARR